MKSSQRLLALVSAICLVLILGLLSTVIGCSTPAPAPAPATSTATTPTPAPTGWRQQTLYCCG